MLGAILHADWDNVAWRMCYAPWGKINQVMFDIVYTALFIPPEKYYQYIISSPSCTHTFHIEKNKALNSDMFHNSWLGLLYCN